MEQRLLKLLFHMQQSRIGRMVIRIIYGLGIIRLYNFLKYKYDEMHPNEEMRRSRAFFETDSVKQRVSHILTLLADDTSREVLSRCIKFRMSHNLKDRPSYNSKDQYFPKGVISLTEREVFVDCGAFDGDSIRAFLHQSHGKFKRIVAFEPDRYNVDALKRQIPDAVCYEAATWSEDGEMAFSMGTGSASHIENSIKDGNLCVKALALDNVPECQDATYIKMDVEGSEYNTLLGAKKVIERNHPKLAVCIYHSDEDMLRLIELIDSWKLGMKMYVRHHAQKIYETVLYVVPGVEDVRRVY